MGIGARRAAGWVLLAGTALAAARGRTETPAARAAAILARMSTDEKCAYLSGTEGMFIRAVPRLGLPAIKMSDGPVGVRVWGKSTAYPAGICLAAGWDPELAQRYGQALGRDARARGVHILLGPAMNIYRSPRCGRNFEYAGEDPWLAGRIASAIVRGVQGEGVLATIKHFAANNQEIDRDSVDARVDERTLREIYLPAFEACIREGGARCVMDAYNQLNGVHCAHSPFLNLQVLRREWGFTGIVMSDWGATHDTVAAANGGLDLEMPGGDWFTPAKLGAALAAGTVTLATVDAKVRHILETIIAAGFLDRPQERTDIPRDDPASAAVALETAREGIVLLKNAGGVLPLAAGKVRRVAVIGPDAHPAAWGGGGSSWTEPFRAVSVLDGLRHVPGLEIRHARGDEDLAALEHGAAWAGPVRAEFWTNPDLAGAPAVTLTATGIGVPREGPPAPGIGRTRFSARWTAAIVPTATGVHRFAAASDDGVRVRLDGATLFAEWDEHAVLTRSATVWLEAGRTYAVTVEYFQAEGEAELRFGWARRGDPVAEAVAAARGADAAVVCVGFNADREGEGWDRTWELPAGQAELVAAVAAANPRTIVVLFGGGGVAWDGWLDRVPAVLHAWYPGQEGGRAVADILFGVVNPSAKLPATFERHAADNPAAPWYLKDDDLKAGRAVYGEGIFTGYRGYDRNGVEPAFCFGHGLSYTTFAYGDLAVGPVAADGSVSVAFQVRNTGRRAGAEVAQVYVEPPAGVLPRPIRELKAFARVTLQPGESKRVTTVLGPGAFAAWSPDTKAWTAAPGRYTIAVGASSRDLRLRGAVDRAD